MTDQFHQPPTGWNPFEFFLGLGGVLSPWWLSLVHGFNEFVAGVAFYGGAALVAYQLWRVGKAQYRAWQAEREG